MALLIFHLVLSSFTFEGVDVRMAQKILDYHIQRYPNGAPLSVRILRCTSLRGRWFARIPFTTFQRCSHHLSSRHCHAFLTSGISLLEIR